ncbi:uncharacterized protein LOC119075545 [Bradysia coprophila]|uniref:uncharacterized protein LOC119075545 n=1 Tax=Bradysia coprophila TaxID=38358 RepID=UPI00187DD3AE|nr:uncharacterized protein LOC119075545 [Bradysia coprophila]
MDKQVNGRFLQLVKPNDGQEKTLAESLNINTGTQLQNMPDDCLFEIFAMRSFDLMDMCSIAATCKRFRSIAQYIVGKTICFKGARYSSFKSAKFEHKTDKPSDIETIFRNFGSCLSTVFVIGNTERQDGFLFSLIVMHCEDVLKSLCLIHLSISATLAKDLKPVFKRLNTLSLSSVSIEGNKSTFEELDSLVELDVTRVKDCSTILENIFPNLKRFTYQKDKIEMVEQCADSADQDHQSLETFSIFIERHSALHSLDIDFECDQNGWMRILQTIGDSCPKLQKLTVGTGCNRHSYSSDLLRPLQPLKSLRIMKLTGVAFKDFQVFESLAALRELELQHCCLPKADQFACLAQITNLSLNGSQSPSGTFDMADVIRQLVNLERFLALKLVALDAHTLSKIVSIVKERSSVLTLVCACEPTVDCEEAFQKSNGHIVVRAEDRYVSTCSFP